MKHDLAMHFDDFGGSPVRGPEEDGVHYPTFHYEGKEDLGLPEEGTMKIRFRRTAHSITEREDDTTRHSYTVEVRHVEDVEGGKDNSPTRRDTSGDDALDALMIAFMKKKKQKMADDEGAA